MASPTIPAEVGRRIEARLEKIAPDLVAILDDAREHGAQYLDLTLRSSPRGEPIRVILADASVTVERAP